uniref:Uncharacterized protein n=1 Tax=Anguilla anguilla TaxID=7936 RepID=A0A0E9UT53_ANGAN
MDWVRVPVQSAQWITRRTPPSPLSMRPPKRCHSRW